MMIAIVPDSTDHQSLEKAKSVLGVGVRIFGFFGSLGSFGFFFDGAGTRLSKQLNAEICAKVGHSRLRLGTKDQRWIVLLEYV